MTHPFDRAIALEPAADGRWRGHTSDAYWNMVSPFGGITAAIALNGVLVQPARLGDPVALTVNYAAQIEKGEFFVDARAVRSSRSTQHWTIQMVQGDGVVANAMAVFGVRRPTWNMIEATPPPVERGAGERFEPPREIMVWPVMYDIRYVRGRINEENADSVTHTWISDATPRAVDFLSLAAYCDSFAPRLLFRRPGFVPLGTVSFNVYFHADAQELAAQGTEPVLGVAQGQVFHKGYFDQQAQMWGRDGRLLATTQQVVWFKE